MGGGSKGTRDASKGAPWNPLTSLQVGFDGGSEYSYCQLEHSLRFVMSQGAMLNLGAPARLVPAQPVQVAVDTGIVGEVHTSHSSDMLGCMEAGYRMVGWIDDLDRDRRMGVVIVRGEPRHDAA
jgi:hypothetical protein